jgi:hypothetical protein
LRHGQTPHFNIADQITFAHLSGIGIGILRVDTGHIAKMFRPWLIAIGARRIRIDRLHVNRRVGIGFQEDKRIMMLL